MADETGDRLRLLAGIGKTNADLKAALAPASTTPYSTTAERSSVRPACGKGSTPVVCASGAPAPAFMPHSRAGAYQAPMSARSIMLAAALAVALGASQAAGAEGNHCLGKEQQRVVVASGKAVRLAAALRSARGRVAGEVVKVRLCESPKGLFYMLTVLARDGKVTRVSVDAASGNLIGGL